MPELEPILPEESLNQQLKKLRKNLDTINVEVNRLASLHENREPKDNLQFEASRAGSVTDAYLFRGGVPTDEVPLLVPENGFVKFVTASTATDSTWELEIRKNGNLLKTLSIDGSGSFFDLEGERPNVTKGDRLSLYCKGGPADKPSVNVVFRLS